MVNHIMNITNWHLNTKERKIVKEERPELFIICSSIFDLINELLLGPNLSN